MERLWRMDFKAVLVLRMTVTSLMDELSWDPYGPDGLHTPVLRCDNDCRKLDLLTDVMGSLSRIMDTHISYVTTEGKMIKEWIERILEIGERYERELRILEETAKRDALT